MGMAKTLSKKEISWILVFGVVVASITTIPYVLGFASQGEDWIFTGFVYGVEDGNSYIAKMLIGTGGGWLFRTPYSTLPQQGVVAFLPFILIGKLASEPAVHEQLVVLYHLLRIFATFFAIYAIYQFIALFIKQIYWRRWATILATVGGGIGWLLILIGKSNWLGSLPLEWYSPEWFGFLSFYGLPHMLIARGLMLIALSLYLTSPAKLPRAWYAGGVLFLLGLVHPLSLVSSAAVIGFHQISIWILSVRAKTRKNAQRWFTAAFRSLILPSPIVLYMLIQFSTDPFLKAWTSQNRIISPHPAHIIIAYGLMFVPVLLGVKKIFKKRKWSGMLLLTWILSLPFLAYAPHNLQRRFPEGIWVAIVIVAALGLERFISVEPGKRRFVGSVLLSLSLPSAFFLLLGGARVTLNPAMPVFRPVDEVKAILWFSEHDNVTNRVLASYETGNALPAWTSAYVVIGHGPESANLDELRSQVESFYSGQFTTEEQVELLEDHAIEYVFFGPFERTFGNEQIMESEFLELVYKSGEYEVYKVIYAGGASP
jgi:hypothetical protein